MNTTNKELHSDIEELLPWHAAGTLSRRDTQRVEEALPKVEEYLESAYEAGVPSVRIVHGKGTGTLRRHNGAHTDQYIGTPSLVST